MIEGPPKTAAKISHAGPLPATVPPCSVVSQKENQLPNQSNREQPLPSPRTVYWMEPSQRSVHSSQACEADDTRTRGWSIESVPVERRYDSPTFEQHHVYHRHQPTPPLVHNPPMQTLPDHREQFAYVRGPRSAFRPHRYKEPVRVFYEYPEEAPWEPPATRSLAIRPSSETPVTGERIHNREQAAVDAILALKRASPMTSPQRQVVSKPIAHRSGRYAPPYRRYEPYGHARYQEYMTSHAGDYKRPGFYLTMRFN
eukprot:CAMPEP_0116579104 /NCGR_PEP_ID=MMETSP0397-20121206/22076_1 /TAXON_ID=216820 /ORGANISM="Cyclophora tenuis, Strain ECT3854" /LENGTH=255 /DNA_ID=CAMNT_0004108567 /DNA_START=33 /DNA_END=800 /DNA_ORIENTATION=+